MYDPTCQRVSGMDTTFFYPFCKYLWISNATRTRTRGYRLVPESVPNGFFTRGHTDNGYPLPSLTSMKKLWANWPLASSITE
jgi:hypothetical protein